RRTPEVVADFRWLSALDPSHQLDRRAPPDLTAIWESVRSEAQGPVTVELRDESEPGTLRVRPVVTGARPEGLRLEAFVRSPGGRYEALDELRGLEREAPEGAELEGYAVLRGPGDTRIMGVGSAEAPLHFVAP